MYLDNSDWNALTLDRLRDVCEELHPVGRKYALTPKTTKADARPLNFYESVELIRTKDRFWEPKNLILYFLRHGETYIWLNGTAPPIYQMNETAPIKLTTDNCLDYLKFFCFFVRGQEGPFLIVESPNDVYVQKSVGDEVKERFAEIFAPAFIKEANDDGSFLVHAVVYYSNAVFASKFKIEASGRVEMIDDEELLTDLLVQVDAPIS